MPPSHPYVAPFITIEGVDGAGKSSHMDTIVAELRHAGFEVTATREPGGTALGQGLREKLKTAEMAQETAALIAFADRSEHLAQKIHPALAKGEAVVSDRFTDSTYAYQSGGDGCDWWFIETLEKMVQKGFEPNMTLFFDLPNEVAAARRAKRKAEMSVEELDKFDEKPEEWFEGVRQAYLTRVRDQPDRFVTIDASQSLDEVAVQVRTAVREFLGRWNTTPRPRGLRR